MDTLLISIIAIVFCLGLLIYFVALGLAFILGLPALAGFKSTVQSNMELNIGVPVSAVGAFGVVSIFWSAFPVAHSEESPLEFSFMGLQFTGAGGPVTLWVLCFLALVFAMNLLRKKST